MPTPPLRFDTHISTDERTLVDIRNFELLPDRITFLFGESGIGKSLIARAVCGLLDPDEFIITINGEPYEEYLSRQETQEIRNHGFYVFQEPSTHLNPLLTLGTQLREGCLSRGTGEVDIMKEMWASDDDSEITRLLEVYPKPYRPSGGEKQRIFLVMALKKIDLLLNAGNTGHQRVFVFDEPTGSLDNHFRDVFLSLLFKRFRQSPFTALVITHDYSMIGKVTRSFGSTAEQVAFRELQMSGNRLMLKDFQPGTYLGWLDRQKKQPPGELGQPLLHVESGAEVFGQTLSISKDRQGGDIAPLEVFPGSMVYLKAPSGTGKTSLVKMIMGLIKGKNLQMVLNGIALTGRTPESFWQREIWGRMMTMAFQHADEALNSKSTVMETFQGLPSQRRINRESIRQTLAGLFDDDVIDALMDKQVARLSGGQKQRLNLLRCLFLETDILILDEPLNGLDFESSTRVLALLAEKLQAGKGILLISHNEEIFDALIPKELVYYLCANPTI